MRRTLSLLSVAVAALASAAPAAARVPAPPMSLPSAATARAASATAWIVGATPSAGARTLAARDGAAELVPGLGAYRVPAGTARAFAAALDARGLLVYAQGDIRARAPMAAAQPLAANGLATAAATPGEPTWRAQIVADGLVPPAVSAQTRPLVLIDTQADVALPGFAGGNVSSTAAGPITSEHGTATLAVAAAPNTGTGMEGVWPGMKAVNIPTTLTCSDIVKRLGQAIALHPAAINMSYGSSQLCYAEYVALQRAVAAGIVPVAAAGNEFFDGNPAEYPASLPHVITVGALAPNLTSSYFSNESAAIDLSAPGQDVLTIVPPAFDKDGTVDDLTQMDGTSFAAPMVAAAITWVRTAKPDLTDDQVAQLVRLTADDIGKSGWDSSTGFGILDIKRALTATTAPPPDPLEPNDDLDFVNGTIFGKKAPAVISPTTRSATLSALVDRFEDPDDLYRMVIPGRTTLSLVAKPAFGDVDLELYGATAKTVESGRHRLAASRRAGAGLTERIRYTNRSSRAITVYANVYIDASVHTLDSRYTLTGTLG